MRIPRLVNPLFAVALAAAAKASGCADSMEDGSLVDELRILAIRADAPEIAPGEGTAFTALWADPKGGGREVTFLWLAAAGTVDISNGFPCEEPIAPARVATIADGGDHYAMASTPEDLIETLAAFGQSTARITVLAVACAGGTLPSPDDLARLGAIDLESDLCKGGEAAAATKVVRISRRETQNTNPSFEAVSIGRNAVAEDAGTVEIPPCDPDGACEDVPVEAALTASSFETYPASETTLGAAETKDELLFFSWFTTAGDLGDARSSVESPGSVSENRLTLAADSPALPTLFIVAHDNRGGTSWVVYSLSR